MGDSTVLTITRMTHAEMIAASYIVQLDRMIMHINSHELSFVH